MPIASPPPPSAGYKFRDPAQPVGVRIDDLMAQLTLPEKISQLVHENNPVERLGIPPYNWWNEACHGVGRNGRATVFPQVIGLAATWNPELVHQVASVISDEARAKHHAASAAGRHGQYQGLTFWTPNINIFRDPRWGRGQETFGEDPFLTGRLGLATVRGLQGENPDHLKVAACAKHFAVHSGPESERHEFDAHPSPKDLNETYLPAFETLVRGGVEAVMGAYNRVLGEPACASRFLLGEVLRKRWGFKGHVVSDCGAVDDFHLHHKITRDAMESAALAVRNGCDLNCGCTYNELVLAVRNGRISEDDIDVALRRLLATKFKLGLFDPPNASPYANKSTAIVDSSAHRALARRAAAESIVLLKNANGALPLRPNPRMLLVAGPCASNVDALLGNYSGTSSRLITVLEGISERVDENTVLEYRAGCPIQQEPPPGLNYTFDTANGAEVVVAVMGLDPTLEGEDGDAVGSLTGGDRAVIELPEVQRAFLRKLRQHAKTLILVLTGGSAIAIPEEHEFCDAVLQVWYPGCEGGRAVADVLFGDASPSGRLPITVPRQTSDLPPFNDYRMQGRTYRFATIEPLYPFGFGLSYAALTYGPLHLGSPTLQRSGTAHVSTVITNASNRPVLEVVQCYLRPPRVSADAPQAILIEFQKVSVPAHATVEVQLAVPADRFLQVNAAGERVWVQGRYDVILGAASPGPRACALGAPAPAVGELQLV